MPWIANVGEAAAEMWEFDGNTACISIAEPGRKARISGASDLLRLEFQDYSNTNGDGSARKPGPPNAVLFNPTLAARISRFARHHREEGRNILVHCAAGISRSGGVVEALLEAFPEYIDKGWPRHPNNLVKTTMKRALGLVPLGAEENS